MLLTAEKSLILVTFLNSKLGIDLVFSAQTSNIDVEISNEYNRSTRLDRGIVNLPTPEPNSSAIFGLI